MRADRPYKRPWSAAAEYGGVGLISLIGPIKQPAPRWPFAVGLAAALLGAPVSSGAQARPDPLGEQVLAVRARHIETVSHGTIEGGVIVVRGGKIVAVGADAKVPVGARVLEADTVMPGIVGAYSLMGGVGATAGQARSDPHLRIADELYPWDPAYRGLVRAGVTTLAIFPAGRGFPGQGAIVRTEADSVERMTLAPNGPLAIDFAPNTQTIDLIRNTLQAARPPAAAGPGTGTPSPAAVTERQGDRAGASDPPAAPVELTPGEEQIRGQRRRQSGAQPRAPGPSAPPDVRRAPVARAVAGETPTIIDCPDAASADYLLPLLKPFDALKPVFILGVTDMFRAAGAFGGARASVVLPAAITVESLTRNRINAPAIYAKAGCKVALRPVEDSPDGYATLRYQVGDLVRNGLDRQTALRAITLSPAEMLGIADRVGGIDAGRDANLLLLDADPLAAAGRVRAVLLEGRMVYEEPAR